ncbi:MAG TPA: hypothetical protein K8V15_10055, partial [Tessaracoccus flavescens]|nr:hypothetical protein [Tessaracoccus flavescens]
MTVPIVDPPMLPYGTVVHRALGVSADGPDVDLHPDLSKIVGLEVEFRASVAAIVWDGGSDPVTHVPQAVQGRYDDQGILRLVLPGGDLSTEEGVRLLATDHPGILPSGWRWSASWSGRALPSATFPLSASDTLDLSTVVLAGVTPGAPTVFADLLAAAADLEATMAGADVSQAVEDYLTANPPSGGVTDHGALSGLGDDDHPHYALADGTRGSFAAPLGPDDNYVTDAEKAALHTHPAVIAQGATAADARAAIGAGTSSFSGAYADLSGKPTLGTAAATASTDYATAAQGEKADTA